MQCKARRAAQTRHLSKRRNAAMRRPDHLPGGFPPERSLDCVALLARSTGTPSPLRDASRALPANVLVRTRALLFMK